MKKFAKMALLLLAGALVFTACPTEPGDGDGEGEDGTPAVYKNFYNYPTGRVNATGLLRINNTVNSRALLFINSVEPANYIGTVDALDSVQIKLDSEKFYTIIAVDKANYEEKTAQASQYSNLSYYSNTQPFSVSVTPNNTSGNTHWTFNNNTSSYWIQVKSADQNTTYAVIPPGALRVNIPVNLGQSYPFIPLFLKELKYNGKVIALSETSVRDQGDIAITSETFPIFTTNFNNANVPTNSIQPTILLVNNSSRTVEVYNSTARLTNGAVNGDFVVASGTQVLISGLEVGANTDTINFSTIAWTANKFVPTSLTMQANKVYRITLANNGDTIFAMEQDGSEVYE
jgi:predicted small secreted protein